LVSEKRDIKSFKICAHWELFTRNRLKATMMIRTNTTSKIIIKKG